MKSTFVPLNFLHSKFWERNLCLGVDSLDMGSQEYFLGYGEFTGDFCLELCPNICSIFVLIEMTV